MIYINGHLIMICSWDVLLIFFCDIETFVLHFSPIKVVSADKEGVVRDGPEEGVDVDYQLHANTLTVTFDGFESERDGIAQHEVAVGTRPLYDDVMSFSSSDIITQDMDGVGNYIH